MRRIGFVDPALAPAAPAPGASTAPPDTASPRLRRRESRPQRSRRSGPGCAGDHGRVPAPRSLLTVLAGMLATAALTTAPRPSPTADRARRRPSTSA